MWKGAVSLPLQNWVPELYSGVQCVPPEAAVRLRYTASRVYCSHQWVLCYQWVLKRSEQLWVPVHGGVSIDDSCVLDISES